MSAKSRRLVFDDEGSFIEDKATGERIWMVEKNGMYTLNMWVRNKDPTGTPVSRRLDSELQAIASSHAYNPDAGGEST